MYTKFAAGAEAAGEVAKIRFWYPTDKIFNSVSLRTHYRANMVKNQVGESQLDDVAISQDELDIVKELISEAVYELTAELFKLTPGINRSTFVDKFKTNGSGAVTDAAAAPTTTATPVGKLFKVITTAWGGFAVDDIVSTVVAYAAASPGPAVTAEFEKVDYTCSGFEITDNAAFNVNLLPSIDKKIEACIRSFVMREWYGSTGMDKDYQINATLYLQSWVKVKNLTLQLRKPLMS